MAVAMVALSATPTLAARGSGGGGGRTGTGGSGSLTLVVVSSPYNDGQPHWNGTVTFNISTSATTAPYVSLDCYQNGVQVYTAMAGFYAGYPWPWTQYFLLSSPSWTAGAANCTATLFYESGTKAVILQTLSFPVSA